MTSGHQEAREFIMELFPKSNAPALSIFMAKISYFDAGTKECSIMVSEDGSELQNCTWLIDAYTPAVGDIVMVMRNGTDKFILGRTTNVR